MNCKLFLFAFLFSSFLYAQNIPGTANDRGGVVTFIECVPAIQYRHLGTVECATLAPDKFDDMVIHMIEKRARKEFPEFDALIFRPGKGLCKADVVQFYRDPKQKKKRPKKGEEIQVDPTYKMSQAVARNNIYLFIENNPTVDFTLLGKLELPANFRSTELEALINEMMRIAKDTYPDHNAIVFTSGTDLRKANIIKLK